MKQANRFWFGGVLSAILVLLFAYVIYNYLEQAQVANDSMMADQITQLQQIFERIHRDCTILGFRNKQDQIDFLTVTSFVGSEVGSMNLLHPENWQGPYLPENPTMQGREFQILGTKDGYYIIPGKGVRLANDKVIGDTLRITPESDMQELMKDPEGLLSSDRVLAARIPVQ